MGYNPQGIMNIYEMIRRRHQGQSISGIAKTLNLDRKTVRQYIRSAMQAGISMEDPLEEESVVLARLRAIIPSPERHKPAAEQFEPHRQEIMAMVEDRHAPLTLKSAWQVICHRYPEITASYSSLKRLARGWNPEAERSTWRHETPPGRQSQIDYAKVGLLYDEQTGRQRVVYAFIGTLSWSRYKFVEFVFSQDQQSFVSSHVKMFAFWGGVSELMRIDCLKSGVIKADLFDPVLNPLYRQMADHYRCFIDPARPGKPKDKGKVERAVKPVRDLFRRLKALDPNLSLAGANKKALHWCRYENGLTRHGTTREKPYECFDIQERKKLLPLPEQPFELARWKQVRVHVDQYVQYEKGYYSLPKRYVGQKLWLRGLPDHIELYDKNFQLIKTYLCGPTRRHSDPTDFPKNIQVMMDDYSVQKLIDKAKKIGPDTAAYIQAILQPHAMQNMRKAMGILELAGKHPVETAEAAARQALQNSNFTYKAFRRLLEATQAELPIPIHEQTREWVRRADYFTHTSDT
ncbi:MAG: IS21 family transposase [Balneolales bacterium]